MVIQLQIVEMYFLTPQSFCGFVTGGPTPILSRFSSTDCWGRNVKCLSVVFSAPVVQYL